LDNASIHKTHAVQKAANEKGYTLLFIPPYTPEVNPIELVFGNIKSKYYQLRYTPRGFDVTDAVMMSIRLAVKPTGVSNTFNHAKKHAVSIARELTTNPPLQLP